MSSAANPHGHHRGKRPRARARQRTNPPNRHPPMHPAQRASALTRLPILAIRLAKASPGVGGGPALKRSRKGVTNCTTNSSRSSGTATPSADQNSRWVSCVPRRTATRSRNASTNAAAASSNQSPAKPHQAQIDHEPPPGRRRRQEQRLGQLHRLGDPPLRPKQNIERTSRRPGAGVSGQCLRRGRALQPLAERTADLAHQPPELSRRAIPLEPETRTAAIPGLRRLPVASRVHRASRSRLYPRPEQVPDLLSHDRSRSMARQR